MPLRSEAKWMTTVGQRSKNPQQRYVKMVKHNGIDVVGCDLCNKWFHWSSGGTVLLCLYRPYCDGWDGGSLNGPEV